MTNNLEYNYLDPTYPAYYWYFNRPKTLLCFSLRRFILILTIYDIIFSSMAVSLSLIYLFIDKLNYINSFQSNEFIQTLTYLPIGIFFDDRILFRSSWTISAMLESFYIIIYLHIILNSTLLLCSINMFMAVKYYEPYRALIYFIFKFACFINITTIFTQWIINREDNFDGIKIFYGNGDLGFFTPNINIFCFALLEWLWKAFTIILIFRSIQYLRNYCLYKELNLMKNFHNEYQSSTQLIIHIIPNNNIVDKQYNV